MAKASERQGEKKYENKRNVAPDGAAYKGASLHSIHGSLRSTDTIFPYYSSFLA